MSDIVKEPNESVTLLLNNWIIKDDKYSANQLKSMVYYHLKGIVKNTIADKKHKSSSPSFIAQLPNTTSLLHDVLIQLTPPTEIMDNREQFYTSLALFVRWMLMDELKAKQAQKRSHQKESISQLLSLEDRSDPYFTFDEAFSQLKTLAPRCYKIALLHYYLGFKVSEMSDIIELKSAMIYNELATAKAYIRTQYPTFN